MGKVQFAPTPMGQPNIGFPGVKWKPKCMDERIQEALEEME